MVHFHTPRSVSQLGDAAPEHPALTGVTAVPESVRSWLSQNNFCLARRDGPAQDFAGFTAVGALCIYVGASSCPSDESSCFVMG